MDNICSQSRKALELELLAYVFAMHCVCVCMHAAEKVEK